MADEGAEALSEGLGGDDEADAGCLEDNGEEVDLQDRFDHDGGVVGLAGVLHPGDEAPGQVPEDRHPASLPAVAAPGGEETKTN